MAGWQPMLEQLVRQRYRSLVAYALLLAPARRDAEDLVQDALVATFGARARFGSIGEAEHYVRRAIASRSVDAARRLERERGTVAAVAGTEPTTASTTDDDGGGGVASAVKSALAGLAPRERACVVLRHVEGLSTRETAHALGVSEGAVKRYLSDGLRTLGGTLGTATEPPQVVRVEVKEVRRGS